ncbi:hypothetical protein CDV31_006480 [Fusarium ambrosium]|uniref:Glycoside hydrolase family 3 C-terminal domain-containing protein n=1 Tax=Fusarium ambrosium TaxID=131363 RepID=A0A428UCM5_9HYPO|nr:hypothetical protein CDV31_006480 [Fusarium ambrosium]
MSIDEVQAPSSTPASLLTAGIKPTPSHVSLDDKEAFLDHLVSKLSVEELAFQLPLISGNWAVGPKSDHGLYDNVLHLAPDAELSVLGIRLLAKEVASDADLIVLTVGAAWNSDGENGDRATLTLSHGQTKLVESMFSLGKPVVLVLKGDRPFAIPEFCAQSAAVLSTSFLGQAAGQAIADVLFGAFNPGGRLMISVPYDAGSLPAFYIHRVTKPEIHIPHYRSSSSALYPNANTVAFFKPFGHL